MVILIIKNLKKMYNNVISVNIFIDNVPDIVLQRNNVIQIRSIVISLLVSRPRIVIIVIDTIVR